MSRVAIWSLVVGVIALQIPYPLVHGSARNSLTIATVVVFAAASLAHACWSVGMRYAGALVGVGLVGFAAEVLGVHTGVPFGDYRYTGGLGPALASVPVVIALAWMMMAHPAVMVARRLTSPRPGRLGVGRILVAAVALASWDVFLDPQMVHAHHWRWLKASPHLPGIDDVPLSNFGGWLLVALLVVALLAVALPTSGGEGDAPMLTLWVWTWLSSTLANLAFFGRPAVAAWGFAAMGVVGCPLLRSLSR